jgi:hypothetical protein
MKSKLFLSLIILTFFSCEKELVPVQGDLGGVWQLKEILSDPGDGSGRFTQVTSDKTIQFFENNVVSSNGNLCNLSIDANNSTTAEYSLVDSVIVSENCVFSGLSIRFSLKGRDTLIIAVPCFEPCASKYVKR